MSKRNEFNPNYAIPPAETLLEVLSDREISLKDLSVASGIEYSILEGIMKTTESITPEIAEKLEKATGVARSFWVNLENNYRARLKRLQ